jgi:multisubunit Na+/H+ antiporter MnhG subunit
MSTVFDRIHYLGPALTAAVLFCAAIAVRQSASLITVKAVTLTLFLLVTSPGLSHVLGRAARIAEHGDWKAKPDEPGVREDR